MKHTSHTLTSRFLGFLWLVTSVCMFVSCSDDTDETGGNFKLYYPDMTDIGPSMAGVKIPAPTFQGATPSEFAIASVTLNDEAIETDCFVIDETTGEITINSTTETAVGEYKLTVSCAAAGRYFTFKDIIKVTFLPRAPEGTVADPNKILVMYNVVSDPNNITKLATAQVKTNGDHVSITKYSIATVTIDGKVLEKPEEMFEVSASGEISIIKSNRFQRGVTYLVSLKLETAATGDTPCIAPDILSVEVASEPFSLTYSNYNAEDGWKMPNTSNDPDGSSFTSETPVFVGSTDGIKYWIEIDNEKGKDKILIDETTGVISVPQGHGFDVGDKFNINVFVANTYLAEGKKLATLKLEVTKFYKPLTDDLVFYTNATAEQTNEITINPENWTSWGYEDIRFDLLNGWNDRLTIDRETGIISAEENNPIAVGEYNVPFRVTNGDGTTKNYSFKLTINENTTKLVWIKCGNNLGENGAALEGDQYENQFRFKGATNNIEFPIRTNLNKEITWTLGDLDASTPNKGITCSISNNKLKFKGDPTGNSIYVRILTGTVTDDPTQTLSVPIFVYSNKVVGNVSVEFSPLALHVNPKLGATSDSPKLIIDDSSITISQFALEYRRNFIYLNWDGKTSITNKTTAFLGPGTGTLWGTNAPSGAKGPMGYYDGNANTTPLNAAKLEKQIGYVDNANNFVVTIKPDKWIVGGEWAQGFVRGEMVFLTDYDTNKSLNASKNSIFPLMIWFDPDYYPVTE